MMLYVALNEDGYYPSGADHDWVYVGPSLPEAVAVLTDVDEHRDLIRTQTTDHPYGESQGDMLSVIEIDTATGEHSVVWSLNR